MRHDDGGAGGGGADAGGDAGSAPTMPVCVLINNRPIELKTSQYGLICLLGNTCQSHH